MRVEITIPSLGESISEATIFSLLKPSGSFVEENEGIVEIETEKVNQLLYAPSSGVVQWSVKEGDKVSIGALIGHVDSVAQTKSSPSKPESGSPTKSPPAAKTTPQPATSAIVSSGRETRRPLTGIRKAIATRLVDALHNAAMLTTFNEVDMSRVMELRTQHKERFLEKHGVKLGVMSFFVKATVEALKLFPAVNSFIDGEEMVERHYYDIGIAVGTERGLFVPVLHDCDKLGFPEIERQIATYAQKARESKLSIKDLEGGSFTITNGGVYGSLFSTPILNPPQSAILGMHKIVSRPVAQEEAVVVRPMMYIALSYDHRVIDGKEAISFLVKIKELLEKPQFENI